MEISGRRIKGIETRVSIRHQTPNDLPFVPGYYPSNPPHISFFPPIRIHCPNIISSSSSSSSSSSFLFLVVNLTRKWYPILLFIAMTFERHLLPQCVCECVSVWVCTLRLQPWISFSWGRHKLLLNFWLKLHFGVIHCSMIFDKNH